MAATFYRGDTWTKTMIPAQIRSMSIQVRSIKIETRSIIKAFMLGSSGGSQFGNCSVPACIHCHQHAGGPHQTGANGPMALVPYKDPHYGNNYSHQSSKYVFTFSFFRLLREQYAIARNLLLSQKLFSSISVRRLPPS